MYRYSIFVGFACLVFLLASCLKGRIPPAVELPVPRIDSTFLNFFKQTNGLIAGEGVSSLPLSDGRTLWLFGNSHVNDYNFSTGLMACTANVHNAAMVSDPNFNITTLNVGTSDFIPSTEANRWYSPLHAYQYSDTVFVFAKKMGGSYNGRTYVAKYRFPDLQFIRIDSMSMNSINFGYSVFLDTIKGFGYIYGLSNPSINANNNLYLARFTMNSLHSSWQYYTKKEWVNVASMTEAITQVPGENVSIRKVRSMYVLLTQTFGKTCNSGNELYTQTSANQWGPFLNPQKIYTIDDNLNGVTPVTYGATLHPQLLNAENEILITYAMNGYEPCLPTCNAGFDSPDFFRVRTLRVGLRRIDLAY